MRILLIEDDEALSDLLARCLREESYAVDTALDGQEGEWLCFENPYDLIILDLMLPRLGGMQVLKRLRDGDVSTPVLILTAKDDTSDIVSALDAGADDYLKKPFSLEEISARIRALLRRKEKVVPCILEAAGVTIDTAKKEAKAGDKELRLTAKEFALLEYFLRNCGSVLTRTQLSEHVWDMSFEPSSNVVDVYIGYLRTKLSDALGSGLIKTVRGHGYILENRTSV